MMRFISFFLILVCVLVTPAEALYSPKKGIGGPVPMDKLTEQNMGWFYNWGYKPLYGDEVSNWTAAVWQKFVPMFETWGNVNTGGIDGQLNEICTKTNYCSRGGSYYLIGNEPDEAGGGSGWRGTTDVRTTNVVEVYGQIAKKILLKDPTAKIIMMGFTTRNDAFADSFIRKWKTRWLGDSVIANLPRVIKGWHTHTYSGFSQPADEPTVEAQGNYLEAKLREVFGEAIVGQEMWVTEMGSLGSNGAPSPNTGSVADKEAFKNRMRNLVSAYELSSTVNRYAWFFFGCNCGLFSPTDLTQSCQTGYSASWCHRDHIWGPYDLYYPSGTGYQKNYLADVYAALPLVVSPTPTGGSGVVSTPTPTPTVSQNCTPCPLGVRAKSLGNANCDSKTSISDFMIWKKERIEYSANPQVRNNWKSDFNCDGRVLDNDLIIWRTNQQ